MTVTKIVRGVWGGLKLLAGLAIFLVVGSVIVGLVIIPPIVGSVAGAWLLEDLMRLGYSHVYDTIVGVLLIVTALGWFMVGLVILEEY